MLQMHWNMLWNHATLLEGANKSGKVNVSNQNFERDLRDSEKF